MIRLPAEVTSRLELTFESTDHGGSEAWAKHSFRKRRNLKKGRETGGSQVRDARDDNEALWRTWHFRNKETANYNLKRRIRAEGGFLGQLPTCGSTSSPGTGWGALGRKSGKREPSGHLPVGKRGDIFRRGSKIRRVMQTEGNTISSVSDKKPKNTNIVTNKTTSPWKSRKSRGI